MMRAVAGTVLSGLLVLVPVTLVIEGRAAGARNEAVATAFDVLRAELAAGKVMGQAFPVWSARPVATVDEPLARARCLSEDVALPIDTAHVVGVKVSATMCMTADRTARRLFAVGLGWEDAAPIRRAITGLGPLYDLPGLGWLRPESHGVLVAQKIWP